MTIPLYVFVQGDSAVLLTLVRGNMTIAQVTADAQSAAAIRVAPFDNARLSVKGRILDPHVTVGEAGLRPLDRVDVVVDAVGEGVLGDAG